MQPIRVLLVDDHALVRAGIRVFLQSVPEIEVVDEAGTGIEAIKCVEANPPDVVLMDILMPEMNGLDAAARLAAKFPMVRIIILSMNTAYEYVREALRNGATGYLQKAASPAELELAIKTVVRGEVFLGSSIPQCVTTGQPENVSERSLSPTRLTSRQREVLQLVVAGFRTKEIAQRLGVTTKTIEMHRAQTMKTLDIHDIPGLVRYAIRVGLIAAAS
jgi:DNA-binding NarL/FixJ family response regulator